MAYGLTARIKTDWLNITDSTSDTRIDNFIEVADRKIDSVMVKVKTVPLTGTDITDEVKRLSEQWAAGLFLQADAKNMDDFRRGQELEKTSKEEAAIYAARFKNDNAVVESTEYGTEPLSSGG